MADSPDYIYLSTKFPELTGQLWFSKEQWKQLRDKGALRTFGLLPSGQIVEYTELITLEQIVMSDNIPLAKDATYIGAGMFHHHGSPEDTVL